MDTLDPRSSQQVRLQLHLLLQSLQDLLPDDLLAAVRRSLAAGAADDAVTALVAGLRQTRNAVREDEFLPLADCIAVLDLDPTSLAAVTTTTRQRPPVFVVERDLDATDDGVLARVDGLRGVLGGWRARRRPLTATPWPPARTVHLFEVADVDALEAVLLEFHGPAAPSLAPDGPLVEAYLSGGSLTPLLRDVQYEGTLEYVGVPDPGFRMAGVFDSEPGADRRPQGVTTLPADDARALLERLDRGRAFLHFPPQPDVFAPELGDVVPNVMRTDGRWIWSETTHYYLDRYRVAPVPDFSAYLTGTAQAPTPPDVVLFLANAWLRGEYPADDDVLAEPTPQDVPDLVRRLVMELQDVLPDGLVVATRCDLVAGRVRAAVQRLAAVVTGSPVTTSGDELDALAGCLAALGLDAAPVMALPRDEAARPPAFRLRPGIDEPRYLRAYAEFSAALNGLDSVLGAWGAWREPIGPAGWLSGCPMFLVEVADLDAVDQALARFYGPQAGPTPGGALVEVYPTGDQLPALHRDLQRQGVMAFVGVDVPPFQYALPDAGLGYDRLLDEGVRLEPDEASQLVDYLRSAPAFLELEPTGQDGAVRLVDLGSGSQRIVLRTDGHWVWSSITAHYLQEHRVAPQPEFLAHLRSRRGTTPAPPDIVVTLARVWAREGNGLTDPAVPPVLTPQQQARYLHLLHRSARDLLDDVDSVEVQRALAGGDLPAAARLLADTLRTGAATVFEAVLVGGLARGGALGDLGPVPSATQIHRNPAPTFVPGPSPDDAGPVSDADREVVQRSAAAGGLLGLWRALQEESAIGPVAHHRPVYLAEVADEESLHQLLRAFYGPDVPRPTRDAPLLEAYVSGDLLPPFHQYVVDRGYLLHRGIRPQAFRFVDTFDGEPGPDGRPQHLVTVAPLEAERLADQLRHGTSLGPGDRTLEDVLAPDSDRTVPARFRTDGTWIWTDAAIHYLLEHRVAPPREFLDDLRSRTSSPEPVSAVLAFVALVTLEEAGLL